MYIRRQLIRTDIKKIWQKVREFGREKVKLFYRLGSLSGKGVDDKTTAASSLTATKDDEYDAF